MLMFPDVHVTPRSGIVCGSGQLWRMAVSGWQGHATGSTLENILHLLHLLRIHVDRYIPRASLVIKRRGRGHRSDTLVTRKTCKTIKTRVFLSNMLWGSCLLSDSHCSWPLSRTSRPLGMNRQWQLRVAHRVDDDLGERLRARLLLLCI